MSCRGAGSSPGLTRTFARRSVIALLSFHSMPESSTAIVTSGRPVLYCQPVCTGLGAQVPPGCVGVSSAMLAPRTPHSSSAWLLTVALLGLFSGVAANFQSTPELNSLGTVGGATLNVCGSWGSPPGAQGKSACAGTAAAPAALSASNTT